MGRGSLKLCLLDRSVVRGPRGGGGGRTAHTNDAVGATAVKNSNYFLQNWGVKGARKR